MSHEGSVDHVSRYISNMLLHLPLTPSEPCIFKVQNPLRKVNEAAFDPQTVAIGPYHRGKESLQLMEEQKLRYLQQLLKRTKESSAERYIVALRELEEPARRCYAESVSLSSNEFVLMMLLDGCFIVELFRKFVIKELRDEHDLVFKFLRQNIGLLRDLMLFENQLPFFVLSKLFDMTDVHQLNFTLIASRILCKTVHPGRNIQNFNRNSMHEVKHLLDLIHNSFFPSSAETEAAVNFTGEKWSFMRCAMELQEASIKFKKVEEDNLFNIKFNNGVMEIPILRIVDSTESAFRNLIAYEQYCVDTDRHYLSEYVSFMDHLIDSPKDIELLCRQGIIDNWLGDDEKVSTLFNTLGENVTLTTFRYSTICVNVNMHCEKRWNVWKANLRRNYFNTPWTLILFLGATFLLVPIFVR